MINRFQKSPLNYFQEGYSRGGVGEEYYDRKRHKYGSERREVVVGGREGREGRERGRARADEWADPWMRSKSPSRKTSVSRNKSYSSRSSYSSSRYVLTSFLLAYNNQLID